MSYRFGQFELQPISAGLFRMDGGAMFGVVPKPLWERKSPPDERNRIVLATNCLLVRTPHGNVLIDTGYGSKAPPRERENYALEESSPLLPSLAATGVRPDDIDRVILTHLHF